MKRVYFYKIPLHITDGKIKISITLSVAAENKRQAIAIAQKEAKKWWLKRFPSRPIKKIEIEAEKIEIKGSRQIETKIETKKKRKPRDPLLPFSKKSKATPKLIRVLPAKSDSSIVIKEEIIQIGTRRVNHRRLEYSTKGFFCYLLAGETYKLIKIMFENKTEKRLVIIGKGYIKIETYNKNGTPLLLRCEKDEKGKIGYYPEFFDGYDDYLYDIPLDEKEIIKRVIKKFRNILERR